MELLGSFAGGIGLFLLGMHLMSEGLRYAAGRVLHRILSLGTRTPLRGLLSGFVITSLVQSSSAITVAIIGFANAGLLTLLQTIYVIYGSNVGTTMTGWLVVLVGFKVSIKALALPLVGLGALLRLIGRDSRRGALGEALAGFGLFFLGIDILKDSFGVLGTDMPLADLARQGHIALFVAVGFLLTFLMQSSSAAMAVTLTAAAGGVTPLAAAAAMVIGANVGTTSTAAMAVLGATPNAQRTAAAHVLFNLLTGAVALVLISPLLYFLEHMQMAMVGHASVPATLALFHTVFNLLGVLLLWPFTAALVRSLEQRFRDREEDLGRPRYLDRNVVATPALALGALGLELSRMGELARTLAIGAMSTERRSGVRLQMEKDAVRRLAEAVQDFAVNMQRTDLPENISASLPNALRVARYYTEVAELAMAIEDVQQEAEFVQDEALAAEMAGFRSAGVQLLKLCNPGLPDFATAPCEERLPRLEEDYQALKAHLLRGGTQGTMKVRTMVAHLDQYSLIHRMLGQTSKATRYLAGLMEVAARYRTDEFPAGS